MIMQTIIVMSFGLLCIAIAWGVDIILYLHEKKVMTKTK